jgi:tetratricopeptide (TPR) repeat protein
LAAIIFIVYKKLPLLATFDVSSIPEEKEAETKQKIMEERLIRKTKVFLNKIMPFFQMIGNFLSRKIKNIQEGILTLEENYKKKTKKEILVTKEEFASQEKKIEVMIQQAEDFINRNDLAGSEKKYLEILSLDPKNVSAYRGLANLYILQKQYEEAKQIFEHILKLNKLDDLAYAGLGKIAEEKGEFQKAKEDYLQSIGIKNASIHYFELGEVCQRMGSDSEARDNLLKALELEPSNPKYLDLLLIVAIKLQETNLAKKVLAKLTEVNPENQKIAKFESDIAGM